MKHLVPKLVTAKHIRSDNTRTRHFFNRRPLTIESLTDNEPMEQRDVCGLFCDHSEHVCWCVRHNSGHDLRWRSPVRTVTRLAQACVLCLGNSACDVQPRATTNKEVTASLSHDPCSVVCLSWVCAGASATHANHRLSKACVATCEQFCISTCKLCGGVACERDRSSAQPFCSAGTCVTTSCPAFVCPLPFRRNASARADTYCHLKLCGEIRNLGAGQFHENG